MSATSPSSLVWLAATIALYLASRQLMVRLRGHPLINTVLLPALIIVLVVQLVPSQAEAAKSSGPVLLWFLGPATVALAVPLFLNFARVRDAVVPAAAALAIGSLTAVLGSVGLAMAMSAQRPTVSSLAPKSVTTPIAMGISEAIGGIPSLSAVFVIITGAVGALTGSLVFDLLRIRDPRARGLALGVAAHGMGTAQAFQVDVTAGIFASVGMTVNGILTALILPPLWRWLS
jgi:predicted murein hydrolase (TIGR00659 family)